MIPGIGWVQVGAANKTGPIAVVQWLVLSTVWSFKFGQQSPQKFPTNLYHCSMTIKRYFALAALLLSLSPVWGQSPVEKIQHLLDTFSFPSPEMGVSIGLVIGGESHFFHRGYTDQSQQRRVDEQSIFEIGSITKLFTGYLVAQAVTEGQWTLTDPIDTYLPDTLHLHPDIQNYISISDLASHQSGLTELDLGALVQVNPKQPFNEVSLAAIDQILRTCEGLPNYGSYRYSNLSYILLGQLLEQRYAQSYANLLKTKILVPARMERTLTTDYDVPNRTSGYNAAGVAQDFFEWNLSAPCGLIKSSAADLTRFLRHFLLVRTGDPGQANRLLETVYFKNAFIELGLGLNILRDERGTVYAKSGDSFGQSSVLAYDPVQNWGLVILTTRADPTARTLYDHIYRQILSGK